MNSGDSESGESNIQGEDKNIIDKILGEMKSEFNKTEKPNSEDSPEAGTADSSSSLNNAAEENTKTEESTNEENHGDEPAADEVEKPRIILSFKKPTAESPAKAKETGRRLRQKVDEKLEESGLKRSARRRSKDCSESVLQSAIARKEKSYNESNKPQRLTRQLKPTQKILENLALAKQEKTKSEKGKAKNEKAKSNDDSFTDEENDRNHRKHKHKHNKHGKKAKRFKTDSSRDSDSDQSVQDGLKSDESGCRRSRRVSTRYYFVCGGYLLNISILQSV